MYQREINRRFVIRTSQPSKKLSHDDLLRVSLIVLVLFYIMFLYAKHVIEANTRFSVKQTLSSEGFGWVQVDVDGQLVLIKGRGTTEDAGRVLALAESSTSRTWLGELRTPLAVDVDFTPNRDAVQPDTVKPTVTPVQEAGEVTRLNWGNIQNTLEDGVLHIDGYIGDKTQKRALIQTAKNALYRKNIDAITETLLVVPTTHLRSLDLAMLATSMLSLCESGKSSAKDGVVTLNCNATSTAAEAIERLQSQPVLYGSLGTMHVNVMTGCDPTFSSGSALATIHFKKGSYALPASHTKAFDHIATLMRACPQLLRVEGHTDHTGNYNFNMNLSFRRAMAGVEGLVARGVKRELLVPYAYGPDRPFSKENDNKGKANNRRIEIHLFNQGGN